MNNVIALPVRRDADTLDDQPLTARLAALHELALMLPSLRTVPGVDPFTPWKIDRALMPLLGGNQQQQQVHAGRLLLHVWNPDKLWRSGAFDIMAALRAWDEDHRLAFMGFVIDPFWIFGEAH